MTSITITRALTKTKTLQKSIMSDLKSKHFIISLKKSEENNSQSQCERIKANQQSISDRFDTIVKIKTLIAESNLNSTVEVAGKKITVTEALAIKELMSLKKEYLRELRSQYADAKREVESSEYSIERTLDSNVSNISSDTDSSQVKDHVDKLKESLEYSMGKIITSCNNKNPEDYIEEVKNKIESFEEEIDFVLSEHNALTSIEID